MNIFTKILSLFLISYIVPSYTYAENSRASELQLTTIKLNHISGDEVLSVLMTLTDKSVRISNENNTLLINGPKDKTNNILPIIEKIDTPPEAFTIEFIASNRKVDFNQSRNTYNSGKSLTNTSQSISIIERQWVTLNTGLSIPIAERKRLADGTETQTFTYKKISKSYLFKVHEFSGWSVIQLGMTDEFLSDDIAGAIEHTKLDTTIIGKTGEWLEVASSKPISKAENENIYTTKIKSTKNIYLYVKVVKTEKKPIQ